MFYVQLKQNVLHVFVFNVLREDGDGSDRPSSVSMEA